MILSTRQTNIPAFQKWPPAARSFSAASFFGFSMKRFTLWTGTGPVTSIRSPASM